MSPSAEAAAHAGGSEIASPLVAQGKARHVASIPSSWIIEQYLRQFQVDVSEYFAGIADVRVYECLQTGYRFYSPPSLAGKDAFYRQLGKFPWFYQEDKWEHGIALRYVQAGHKVLDVGCGTGKFIEAAMRKNAAATGIELNQDAATTARGAGLDVAGELVDEHARHRPEHYDIVSAFQVLEHVPAPRPFIADCLRALRPGGLFIVGVPNNDGFIKFDPALVLNGPPHHMGLWTRRSLSELHRVFPLDVVCFEFEPLKVIGWYQSLMEQRYLPKGWMRSLYYRLGGAKIFKRYLEENAGSIAGHTIMVVYRKRREPALTSQA